MKVALDISTAVTQQAGVARYTRELYGALAALPDSPQLCPVAFAPRIAFPPTGLPLPRLLAGSVRGWRLRFALRHLAGRPLAGPWDTCDIYHATDMIFPPLARTPVVATVHDLTFISHPRFHTRLNGTYLRLSVPLMARRARMVIADSQSTRDAVIEHLGVPASRIAVVYPGLSRAFSRPPTDEHLTRVRARYRLPHSFVLSVGTLEPRKNLRGAVAAYRLLGQRQSDLPPLVLVGGAGWHGAQLGLGADEALEGIRRLGHVPDDDLLALYGSCSAFLYPSFYEGFGFPVLEALALGAPVVTSNRSSLPEITGQAAMLIDPDSVEEIAQALERVLCDASLAARLRREGPLRASSFTYNRCARETSAVYAQARTSDPR